MKTIFRFAVPVGSAVAFAVYASRVGVGNLFLVALLIVLGFAVYGYQRALDRFHLFED